MGKTNTTITVYRDTRDWQGAVTLETVGQFPVWFEQHNTLIEDNNGQVVRQKALIIAYQDIELAEAMVQRNETRYEILAWDKYYDRTGKFHHLEAILI